MRNLFSALSLAALSLLAGCAAPPPPQKPLDERQKQEAKPNLGEVRTIRLECGQSGGIPGAPRDVYLLELTAGGPCRATVTHGNNWDSNAEKTTYDLPIETFAEVQRALMAADFFTLASSRPEAEFENSASWISVTCDGKYYHGVSVMEPAPAPRGYDEIFRLARQVEKKGVLTGKVSMPVVPDPPVPRQP